MKNVIGILLESEFNLEPIWVSVGTFSHGYFVRQFGYVSQAVLDSLCGRG